MSRMNRTKYLRIIAALVCSIGLLCIAVTYSWFHDDNTLTFPKNFGSSNIAYFGGGDGSESDPYIINNPVHLYNLAWLQYLGYFNMRDGLNNGKTQSYFKVVADINMSALSSALPPIGTAEYPFIGNIDGNGYKIYNVSVSNKKTTDITVYPTGSTGAQWADDNILTFVNQTDSTYPDVQIIGLFGVIGNYNGYTDTYKTANSGFNENVMSVTGIYIDNLHIKSHTETTLVGLAAGYVGGNMSNVGVYRSDMSVASGAKGLGGDSDAVISKYSLVGDCDSSLVSTDWSSSDGSSSQDGWGGSINMKLLAQRLSNIMATAGDGSNYYSTQASATATNGFYYSEKYSFYGNFASKNALSSLNYAFNPNVVSGDSVTVSLLGYSGYNSSDTNYAYTVLPLNVDEGTLGLTGVNNSASVTNTATVYKTNSGWTTSRFDKSSTSLASGVTWSLTSGYKTYNDATYKTEPVSGNTGYIVGNSTSFTQFNAGIQINVREFTNTNNIYKAFGKTSASAAESYDDGALRLTTYVAGSGFKQIADEYNNLTGDKTIASSTLLKYDDSRSSFGSFLGGNGYLYGLTFSSYGCKIKGQGTDNTSTLSQTISRTVNLYGEKKTKTLLTGAINFNVKEAGVVVAIVGTHNVNANKGQSAFNIYQVGDNLSTDGSTISGVTEISKVYKDSDGTIYNNPTDTSDKTLVYDKSWYNVSDASYNKTQTGGLVLEDNNAYYIEIPLEAGDYVLGTDSNTLGYLMYLDIGTSGGSGSSGGGKTYAIKAVDFVNGNFVTVVDDGSSRAVTYNDYDDVTFSVGGITVDETVDHYVVFKRSDGTPDKSSKVAYNYIGITTVTPSSGTLSEKKDDLAPSSDS